MLLDVQAPPAAPAVPPAHQLQGSVLVLVLEHVPLKARLLSCARVCWAWHHAALAASSSIRRFLGSARQRDLLQDWLSTHGRGLTRLELLAPGQQPAGTPRLALTLPGLAAVTPRLRELGLCWCDVRLQEPGASEMPPSSSLPPPPPSAAAAAAARGGGGTGAVHAADAACDEQCQQEQQQRQQQQQLGGWAGGLTRLDLRNSRLEGLPALALLTSLRRLELRLCTTTDTTTPASSSSAVGSSVAGGSAAGSTPNPSSSTTASTDAASLSAGWALGRELGRLTALTRLVIISRPAGRAGTTTAAAAAAAAGPLVLHAGAQGLAPLTALQHLELCGVLLGGPGALGALSRLTHVSIEGVVAAAAPATTATTAAAASAGAGETTAGDDGSDSGGGGAQALLCALGQLPGLQHLAITGPSLQGSGCAGAPGGSGSSSSSSHAAGAAAQRRRRQQQPAAAAYAALAASSLLSHLSLPRCPLPPGAWRAMLLVEGGAGPAAAGPAAGGVAGVSGVRRLPRLRSLSLRWPGEAECSTTLSSMAGAAAAAPGTGGQLTWTPSSSSSGGGGDTAPVSALAAAATGLRQLALQGVPAGADLAGLAGLAGGLTSLRLSGGFDGAAALRHLAALTGLEDCHVCSSHERHASLAAAAPLTALSRLSALSLSLTGLCISVKSATELAAVVAVCPT